MHILFVFRIYSYTHELVSYGGFVHLYISIDVEFKGPENAEEAKGQADYKSAYYSGSELQCCVYISVYSLVCARLHAWVLFISHSH